MKLTLGITAITSLPTFTTAAKLNCPLSGPVFPFPTNLLQSPSIASVAATLDEAFFKNIDNDTSTGSGHFSYAAQVFTASDGEDEPLWARYWTAPDLGQFQNVSGGVSVVDGDTVFRIGSVTKIFTVLTFLATVGDGIWNEPVGGYLPEVEEMIKGGNGRGVIYTPDWEAITVDALLGELSQQLNITRLVSMGFPPLENTSYPPCGTSPTCDREQLFAGIAQLPPSYAPFTTPTYSDVGFVLLSFIAEKVTGQSFKDLVQENVLTPLGLKHTFYQSPEDDSVGVIPGTKPKTTWGYDLGVEMATGNMYTSATDLAALGRAILRSTLVKPAVTKRWLKPTSYSSDPKATVGMPWGIRRVGVQKNQTYYEVHTFNKIGSIGAYSAVFALIPELQLGFSILAAGPGGSAIATAIAEALADTYIPTIDNIARAQANVTFAGHYRHASLSDDDGNTGPKLNSSLTVSVDPYAPGLHVTSWLSNSTDMGLLAVALAANVSAAGFPQLKPSVRLYPTGLEQPIEGDDGTSGGKKVAFKAVFEDMGGDGVADGGGAFVNDCGTWVGVTGVVYGRMPLDLFVFEVGADGVVQAVVNEGLRVRLVKVD
ncbi:beta-lactamase/transpeptidase-like protein [Dichotomopilus funicola]|uniref:Beta-lactamase/transpeptidase-like protein n=1 Tax=Dichotomopilus funicola TaxID=1934379 RepID=A0AAN6UV57_9PEZI|nr:beta-lactamase/transpeptidase-like protein [Dichotomopilus funicola]